MICEIRLATTMKRTTRLRSGDVIARAIHISSIYRDMCAFVCLFVYVCVCVCMDVCVRA